MAETQIPGYNQDMANGFNELYHQWITNVDERMLFGEHFLEECRSSQLHKCEHPGCQYETRDEEELASHLKQHVAVGASCFAGSESSENQKKSKQEQKIRPKCTECGYTAASERSMARHMELQHGTSNEIYYCNSCKYATKSKVYLRKHYYVRHRNHGEDLVCPELGCDFKTKIPFRYTQHYKNCSGRDSIYKCPFCDYTAKNKQVIKRHKDSQHDVNQQIYKCKVCLYETESMKKFRYHEDTKHISSDQSYKCLHCSFVGKCRLSLLRHIKRHNDKKDLECPELGCDFKTKMPHVYTQHYQKCIKKARNHKCPFCDYTAKNRRVMKRHKDSHDPSQQIYKCKLCDYGTDCPAKLKYHEDTRHESSEQTHNCEQCSFVGKCQLSLLRHVRKQHSGGKDLKCPELGCDFKTKMPHVYTQHYEKCIKKASNHKCPFCDYTAKNRQVLKRHKNRQHDASQQIYKCELCDYETERRAKLTYHEETRHPSSDQTYNCEQCSFVGKCRFTFLRHVRRHNRSDRQCPQCSFRVKDKATLQKHIAIVHETDKNVFCCANCDYSTNWKENLVKHINIHHNDALEILECTEPGCSFKTKIKRSLRYHVRKVHNGEPSYKCNFCEHETKYADRLRKHMEDRHEASGKIFKCLFCPFESTSVRRFKYHVDVKHDNAQQDEMQCSYCGIMAESKLLLTRHVRMVHTAYSCSHCSYKTNKKYHYLLHLNKHGIDGTSDVGNDSGYYQINTGHCRSSINEGEERNVENVLQDGNKMNVSLDNRLLASHKTRKQAGHKCSQCPSILSSRFCLRKHERKHKIPDRQCPHCLFRTKDLAVYKRHMLQNHTDNKPVYSCADCDYSTYLKKYLTKHCEVHHNDEVPVVKCSEPGCSYKTKRKGSLAYHMKILHQNGPYNCNICLFQTKRLRSLKKHLEDRHETGDETYKCSFCPFESKSSRRFNYHLLTKHDDNQDQRRCQHCHFMCKSQTVLDRHVRKTHGAYSRLKSEQVNSSSQKDANTEMQSTTNIEVRSASIDTRGEVDGANIDKGISSQVESSCCGSLKSGPEGSKSANKTEGDTVPEGNDTSTEANRCSNILQNYETTKHVGGSVKHKCSVCPFVGASRVYLRRHEKIHKMPDRQCTECQFKTKYLAVYQRHMLLRHTVNKPLYYCAHCEYTTPIKMYLNNHFRGRHVAQTFECPVPGCLYKSKLKDHLRIHQKAMHQDVFPFKCSLCDFKTKYPYSVQKHMNNKHRSSDEVFKCSFCPYTSSSKLRFSYHVDTQHDNSREDERRCPHCKTVATSVFALKRHMKARHGTFACPKCYFRCYIETNYLRHLQKHESKVAESIIVDKIEIEESKIQYWSEDLDMNDATVDRIFYCSRCSYKSDIYTNYLLHQKEHDSVVQQPPMNCGSLKTDADVNKTEIKTEPNVAPETDSIVDEDGLENGMSNDKFEQYSKKNPLENASVTEPKIENVFVKVENFGDIKDTESCINESQTNNVRH